MLHQRPNTFAQTCLLALSFSLQSDGGPYMDVQVNNFRFPRDSGVTITSHEPTRHSGI